MKTLKLIGVAVFVNASAFGWVSGLDATQGEENNLIPVILALIMIAGGITARLIAKRKAVKGS